MKCEICPPPISKKTWSNNKESSRVLALYSIFKLYSLGCPGFFKSLSWKPIFCPGLDIYLRSHQKNLRLMWADLWSGHAILYIQRNGRKNTKENMPSDHFCSHFYWEGRINLIPSPEFCIFIAVSGDTHIEAIFGHISIWLYGHMAKIWSYGHLTIWPKWPKMASIWVSPETAIKL